MTSLERTLASALALAQAGRLPEAERIYRELLAAHPDHAPSLHGLGAIAYRAGDAAEAARLFAAAIAQEAAVGLYHANFGQALRKLGRVEDALAAYRAAIRLAPDLHSAQLNAGVIELGRGN